MDVSDVKNCIGISKTTFNSSACVISNQGDKIDLEVVLTERLSRKKNSGAWPEKALQNIKNRYDFDKSIFADNRDVLSGNELEIRLNNQFPFYEHIRSLGLESCININNNNLTNLTHHMCHAEAVNMISPFRKSLILVIDGAGSNSKDFLETHSEFSFIPKKNSDDDFFEEYSVYSLIDGDLRCLKKKWQIIYKKENGNYSFGTSVGLFYEEISKYIFNDKLAAGKVMGLAAYGKPQKISDRIEYLETLDWSYSFKGKGKAQWESSNNIDLYANMAASVQQHFEEELLNLIKNLKLEYPEYNNLILTGGCALNCTNNMKLLNKNVFDNIFIPPFPGDESISLGAASYLWYRVLNNKWTPVPWNNQISFFGSKASVPTELEIKDFFANFNYKKPHSITEFVAEELLKGKIIAWFQGRSEIGPRALGHRSILAFPDQNGLKSKLNNEVKFRESFRPYGCIVLSELVSKYFEVPEGFQTPFMTFAVEVKPKYRERLKEVSHFDFTSRIQTINPQQDELIYKIIQKVGEVSSLFCILNTSLNLMGEPIVETIEDARNFLLKSNVDGLAIGDYFIYK
ncbi:MAG: hypothetical protein KDD45_07765 [Bdellovibrionales bacterium]|nr:hypothetical protein [Bdellovibrionales bacterium]